MSFTVDKKDMVNLKEELPPCPFCGSTAHLYATGDYNFVVKCDNNDCNAMVKSPCSASLVGTEKAAQDAINNWKRRKK